ncbi:MAG: prephenate dehydrogenase/arogenate dehydrogenase family protein [Sphaerochaeta sp.]|jgi:prephenate dehydrogenase|nr:prephenate dehydrogenase/arogenate dehydrogenase family protein [Sphaerochaeta sp.]MCH3919362.1 prephenate dehydrogenase/arogenate dehydrogenase family protein [Sphaerochaeta sp.]MCI2076023.1 prephenate dehydrogenase/arogenate dehydrogenase family protein [Sphaerochaeta sp.]MCI2128222.1 prephenate dehydrogenase/arogenate dehydrogenase family protein [Sphaerochaeta sp.]
MRVGVYGLGRFGAFWARQLAMQNLDVCGYSLHQKPPIEGVEMVDEDTVLSCETIFFCVAISSFSEVIERVKDRIKPGTLVMDTCSVKLYPADVMDKKLSKAVYTIATHPMFGPDSGKHGIKGLPMVVCPLSCPVVIVNKWLALFKKWGLDVIRMTCDEHDKEAAWSQGVTHFVGRTLDQLHLKDTRLATTGYKLLMSIVEQTCNDPIQLFYDLQRYNPYAKEMRMSLKSALDVVMQELKEQET